VLKKIMSMKNPTPILLETIAILLKMINKHKNSHRRRRRRRRRHCFL
jgi:hypothetical protein